MLLLSSSPTCQVVFFEFYRQLLIMASPQVENTGSMQDDASRDQASKAGMSTMPSYAIREVEQERRKDDKSQVEMLAKTECQNGWGSTLK
ncbi:hypothetical protein Nepgr_022110 [Nepenthes gracilis]|uniref:Uncharacterized protein n=1 Tax=Nepenthes gracilis TaxID=150966 RepID=A0AAD3T093_NEPGR|nr:hypothetical protein Nepgr_022110 [Nepenthes gracilis]